MLIPFPVVCTKSWRSNVAKWNADRSLTTVGNEEYGSKSLAFIKISPGESVKNNMDTWFRAEARK